MNTYNVLLKGFSTSTKEAHGEREVLVNITALLQQPEDDSVGRFYRAVKEKEWMWLGDSWIYPSKINAKPGEDGVTLTLVMHEPTDAELVGLFRCLISDKTMEITERQLSF